MSAESKERADKFLAIASEYKLGKLVTESSHPDTENLSEMAKKSLPQAIAALKGLDSHVITVLKAKSQDIHRLKDAVCETLNSGNNIFLCGCGATGRLSLTLETIWRQAYEKDILKDRVFSFMAGGDVALIRSIENFEDFPQYGARQLLEAGFKDGDLLIGTTEGGETPFVIGAVEKAGQLSRRKPFFIYCNPDDVLCEVAERSKLVIENTGIEKINLTVGPMAVTGSTRMQSSTVLLAAAGIALFNYGEEKDTIDEEIQLFSDFWNSCDISFIEKFILTESDFYRKGEYLFYDTDEKLGITIITDTTERSPTFSLYPFENSNETEQKPSLCYLYMPDAENSESAWESLLWRAPRTLEWPDINGIASRERLLGFDFSKKVKARREHQLGLLKQHRFEIRNDKSGILFMLGTEEHFLNARFSKNIYIHLVLKMILNIHSTLIMGRLGRYEGNVMTYVRASNNKLIDRAIRYADMILKSKNIELSYTELCYILFETIEKTAIDESIVLAVVKVVEKRSQRMNQ